MKLDCPSRPGGGLGNLPLLSPRHPAHTRWLKAFFCHVPQGCLSQGWDLMETPTPSPSLETPCSFRALENELPTGLGLQPPCTEWLTEWMAPCGGRGCQWPAAHTFPRKHHFCSKSRVFQGEKDAHSEEDGRRGLCVLLHVPPAPPSLPSSHVGPPSVPHKHQAPPHPASPAFADAGPSAWKTLSRGLQASA